MPKKIKGQLPIILALIGAGATICTSFIGSYYTAQSKAKEEIAEVATEVKVLKERESNHYSEVEKSLTKIDKKLDTLLLK